MSKTTRPHYVSRCHLREFFNSETKQIYYYDKETSNIGKATSVKPLFSVDNLNTNGENENTNYANSEKELKLLFEDNFPNYLVQIQEIITSKTINENSYDTLRYLTMMGIIGELRNPNYQKMLHDIELSLECEILNYLQDDIENILTKRINFEYSKDITYKESASTILKKMEPITFVIYKIESNDHFIVPDTSSFTKRGQLKNYMNPYVDEIIQVGLPVSDKIFILATSSKVNECNDKSGLLFIRENNSDVVFRINKELFQFAKRRVACKDREFLKTTVNKIIIP